VALSHQTILDKISNVRGAVMMAYPMGLPEWDVVKMSLDSKDGFKVSFNFCISGYEIHNMGILETLTLFNIESYDC
jgi:hypothetical protein